MKTPIFDFVKTYAESNISRLHMPGHKGKSFLGCEAFDITEISGADSLYEADGIIDASEKNASEIFKTGATFYSTEGSSLSIKAMIYAAFMAAEGNAVKKIAAVRNVHKSFINACAMLGIDIEWIYPSNADSLCSGTVSACEADKFLSEHSDIFALYLTSPNYLGQLTDIQAISEVCRKHHIPLLVDNAHGAYLKFCEMHPIALGADMCCDSAHKTLPVLTGGSYLHVSPEAKAIYSPYIKNAMSVFGSTSPSYLILASLDLCNKYLADGYAEKLKKCIDEISKLKDFISKAGFEVADTEPLKITILTNGNPLADMLRIKGIECEYADKTALVLMFTPENSDGDFEKIRDVFSEAKPKPQLTAPKIVPGIKKLSVREAFISPFVNVTVENAVGCICATPCISCPPAIPIAVSGELITEVTVEAFKFYGIDTVNVIKESDAP